MLVGCWCTNNTVALFWEFRHSSRCFGFDCQPVDTFHAHVKVLSLWWAGRQTRPPVKGGEDEPTNFYADPSIAATSTLRPLLGKNVGKDLRDDPDWQFCAVLEPIVEPITGYQVPMDDVSFFGIGADTNITSTENAPSHDGHILPDALLEQQNLEGDINDVNDIDLHDHDDDWLEVT